MEFCKSKAGATPVTSNDTLAVQPWPHYFRVSAYGCPFPTNGHENRDMGLGGSYIGGGSSALCWVSCVHGGWPESVEKMEHQIGEQCKRINWAISMSSIYARSILPSGHSSAAMSRVLTLVIGWPQTTQIPCSNPRANKKKYQQGQVVVCQKSQSVFCHKNASNVSSLVPFTFMCWGNACYHALWCHSFRITSQSSKATHLCSCALQWTTVHCVANFVAHQIFGGVLVCWQPIKFHGLPHSQPF